MKKATLLLVIFYTFSFRIATGQQSTGNPGIDIMLIRGEYKRVIDTCTLILRTDSLNAEIYYKMGLACQNLLPDDKSMGFFIKAASIEPENVKYKFMVAKSHFARGKNLQAKPLFESLCRLDSMNWGYAYYMTSIYMQEGRYDESLKVYKRFLSRDSANYVYFDKIGFAYIQKIEYDTAIYFYDRSLVLYPDNISALKNLAFLYSVTTSANKGLKLLTRALSVDSTDLDLYARRAALNYTIFNYKRALPDYLKIIASGDSSALNLKRAGICFANDHRQKESIEFLLKAHAIDTADYEIVTYLAQDYFLLNDFGKSEYYYNYQIRLLEPAVHQTGTAYILLGGALKADNRYTEAISAYQKSLDFRSDNYLLMNIANLYDEKLNDIPRAIKYYELYLKREPPTDNQFTIEYNESVKARIETLKVAKALAENKR